MLDCEVLVLWNVDVLHLIVVNISLLSSDDVLKEVDGHVVYTKRVS